MTLFSKPEFSVHLKVCWIFLDFQPGFAYWSVTYKNNLGKDADIY